LRLFSIARALCLGLLQRGFFDQHSLAFVACVHGYAGTYQFPDYSLKMVPEGNHLLVQFDDGSTLPVFPESETKFFSKPWPTRFEFSKSDNGEFTAVKQIDGDKEENGVKK
jgi:hypothetical protein